MYNVLFPQGCEDTSAPRWLDLRHHVNDPSLKMHGQYASWPVVGHAATIPCRMFRILLTGPNANTIPRQDTVCLSGFEFYGYLHDVELPLQEHVGIVTTHST